MKWEGEKDLDVEIITLFNWENVHRTYKKIKDYLKLPFHLRAVHAYIFFRAQN